MDLSLATRKISDLTLDLSALLKFLNKDDKICCGLTWQQSFTVETLSRNGSMLMGELAGRMGVAESTATRGLNILVRDGILARENCCDDKRQVRAVLTSKGRSLAKTLIECREKAIGRFLGPISAAGRKELILAMEKIMSFVRKVSCC